VHPKCIEIGVDAGDVLPDHVAPVIIVRILACVMVDVAAKVFLLELVVTGFRVLVEVLR
jgi:hypothetical protein